MEPLEIYTRLNECGIRICVPVPLKGRIAPSPYAYKPDEIIIEVQDTWGLGRFGKGHWVNVKHFAGDDRREQARKWAKSQGITLGRARVKA